MIMMSSRPCFFSAAFSSGTAVRWAAASEETPRMWTSFSTAWRAASSAVANRRPNSNAEADIGEGRRDHLLAAVVTVLADFCDQDARAAALGFLEGVDQRLNLLDPITHAGRLPLVDAGDGLDFGAVPAEHLLHRIRNFADGCLGPCRVDGEREQIAVAFAGRARQRGERGIDVLLVALGLQPRQLVDLEPADVGVVNLENIDRGFVQWLVLVDANHRLLAGIDARLRFG